MASVPYISQDAATISKMLNALELARTKKSGGPSVKKSSFAVKASSSGLKVDSWKMQDWDYKKPNLPTYARGLFTTPGRGNGDPEIVVRGYDKFFNVDEVPETGWNSIIARTQPPFELTLKENGCIIFISGLEDDTLLVCSKHSTGDRDDIRISHASAGERRIEKQLAAVGKTKEDLARELRGRNATAVAELCDDEFEEHVLAYKSENSGLYLHGVNLNLPEFVTYPSSAVQQFAQDWGFLKTGFITMHNVHEVKTFLEAVAQTGSHEGREVEGFVIRCKMSVEPGSRPFQDWFFKFKFEEPYLMYRQWRECTKSLIAGKSPRFKKHRNITSEYLLYARKRLAADPELGKSYNQNHGIISLREDFLRIKDLKGYDAACLDEVDLVVFDDVLGDVILCPIATIGCGKTTLAIAMTHLFSWGHIQNDNIAGKGRPPRFTKAILDLLRTQPVVFADRNNATKQERRQIINDVGLQHKSVKMVCLNFRHDEDAIDDIRRITQARVLARGDNHQTIHAASDRLKYINVMEGFVNRFEPCVPYAPPDDGFDVIIDLDPRSGTRHNLETTVKRLRQHFPGLVPFTPSAEQYDKAMEVALAYRPASHHDIPSKPAGDNYKIKPRLEYMSVDVPSAKINGVLQQAFDGASSHITRLYLHLMHNKRLQAKYHVTLMHRANSADQMGLWQRYVDLWEASGSSDAQLDSCNLMLERIVFDDRLMTIVVRLIDNADKWECVNRIAHITVGTRDKSVKPKESNDLLNRWIDVGADGRDICEINLEHRPVIKGVVRGVRSR